MKIEKPRLEPAKIEGFLIGEYGLSHERIDNTLKRMDKAGVGRGQTGLSMFGRK